MTEKNLRRLDLFSAALLVLWLGLAIGFAFVQAPVTFKLAESRDVAGRIVGASLVRLEWAAWIAFGLSLALVWVPRWLAEFKEKDGVGPLRLWSAAALAALLMCFASSFIVTPRMAQLRAHMAAPIDTVPQDHPDRVAHGKAHRISTQLMGLRMLLALGLAIGVAWLPRRKDD
ncbi:MAG: DUF4149 domain-containing protein [Firmicutes bacterium]|nr:DUF4149 domain-containing protein [Bacillota bacterium]